MPERYEKRSAAEIAVGGILSLITAYNTITTVLTQTPAYVSSQHANPQLEEILKSSRQELTRTLEIDPTQIDIFDTLIGF